MNNPDIPQRPVDKSGIIIIISGLTVNYKCVETLFIGEKTLQTPKVRDSASPLVTTTSRYFFTEFRFIFWRLASPGRSGLYEYIQGSS
jgi:hypothetical protein